jgi:hypothetical protein
LRAAVVKARSGLCDGLTDDDDSSVDASTATLWYTDADGDSFGSASDSGTYSCSSPFSGAVLNHTDCVDTDASTYPGAAYYESATACMTDADGDGYGDLTPVAAATAGTDCDDAESTSFPGATEVCDEVDQDCDGVVDDGVQTTFYGDGDGDGYGDSASTEDACSAPSGYVSNATDCDDDRADVNPGATEVCDSADTDEARPEARGPR